MLIIHEEIDKAILSMHGRKLPEADGMVVVELFKIITPKLYIVLNSIIISGICHGEWDKALICTPLKGGSLNDLKSYRSILLLNITSKMFTKGLNERLTTWAENQSVYKEKQAGFRKRNSTIDQIIY